MQQQRYKTEIEPEQSSIALQWAKDICFFTNFVVFYEGFLGQPESPVLSHCTEAV